ncbi:putative TPRXL [Fagus crenata]
MWQHQKQPNREVDHSEAPMNHPGSFRCSLPKGLGSHSSSSLSAPYSQNRLNARRSVLTNSLVRLGKELGFLLIMMQTHNHFHVGVWLWSSFSGGYPLL